MSAVLPPFPSLRMLVNWGDPLLSFVRYLLLSHRGLAVEKKQNKKTGFMNPFAFNYWSCLNLPTLKNKNGGIQDGGQLIQRDRQTQNPFGYLSVGVKPSTAVIGPFSHTSKRRFSCRNSGRAAIKKIFKTFLWYLKWKRKQWIYHFFNNIAPFLFSIYKCIL